MKKTMAFFAAFIMCFSFISSVGHVFAAETADSLTVIDLVQLKNHVIGSFDYNSDFDYNEDNTVNAEDLIVLKRILFGLPYAPVEPDDKDNPDVDDDGFYEDVVKP